MSLFYLRFFVDKITELVAIQVEENPNGGAHIDATFRSITMNVVVEEPGSLLVDVHRPAPLVFTYSTAMKNDKLKRIINESKLVEAEKI